MDKSKKQRKFIILSIATAIIIAAAIALPLILSSNNAQELSGAQQTKKEL